MNRRESFAALFTLPAAVVTPPHEQPPIKIVLQIDGDVVAASVIDVIKQNRRGARDKVLRYMLEDRGLMR